jgi:hypothetical protein
MAAAAIHFANKNASFASAAPPVSGARYIGPVFGRQSAKKSLPIFGQALDRKIISSKFKRSGE